MKNYMIFIRFIAVITMITGFLVGATAFMNSTMSEIWYVLLAYFFAGCTVSSGAIVFITAKFEQANNNSNKKVKRNDRNKKT